MPVRSLPEDKPKIVFHAAMMVIQNFGFFTMYYDVWGRTPGPLAAAVAVGSGTSDDPCQSTRFACGFMAMTCFMVAFLCLGMGFGGYTDDVVTFALYWFLHLAGGGCYTICTVLIPLARWSEEGKVCANLAKVNGDRVEVVYYMHAALYFVYVGGMLSITYFSFVKPTFLQPKQGIMSDKATE
eukprot:TRINITY_DN17206_c0_g1_i1.p1 TRINITY_DN17206_c0_g1~~TRINITY_DN17206_c0_g1_i1.p1  ORF type:complete len:183 (+),score=14.34 TRINITY_DN17206_c0_g1_i1:60-608(+)